MSDHEFEKQVRQKLNDLRLTPSAASWQKIEQGIGRNKRRSTPLYWLALILIGLGAGGYFSVRHFISAGENATGPTVAKHDRQPVERYGNTPASSGETKEASHGTDIVSPDIDARSKLETSTSTTPNSHAAPKIQKTAPLNPKLTPQRPKVEPVTSKGTSQAPGSDASRQTAASHAPKATSKDSQISPQSPSDGFLSNDIDKPYTSTPDVAGSHTEASLKKSNIRLQSHLQLDKGELSATAIKPNYSVPGIPSAEAVPPLVRKNKRWSFGISAFAGISGPSNGKLFDINKAMTADMQRPANAAFAPSYTPYRIVADATYSAGLVAKRELSKRFHVSAGLNYLQLSSRYKVGNQVYGSQAVNAAPLGQYVRNYFTVEQHQPRDYRNVYQYIEVPVLVHTRLNQSNKLPLYWNIGASYAHLLKSNSKQFDGSTGVYYRNEKQVNRSQVAVALGFDFALFSKRSMPLWVAPMARYSITRQTNTDAGDQRNYLSTGLSMKLFLK